MPRMAPRPQICSRAREWLSLRLDGQLSELEHARLDAHVKGCTACADYGRDVAAVTAALREVRLEPLPHPIAVGRRARVAVPFRAIHAGAAAAVLIAATALGSIYGVVSDGGATRTVASRASKATAFGSDVRHTREVLTITAQRRADPMKRTIDVPRNRDLSV